MCGTETEKFGKNDKLDEMGYKKVCFRDSSMDKLSPRWF